MDKQSIQILAESLNELANAFEEFAEECELQADQIMLELRS